MSKVAIGWKFWILWVLVCIGGGFGCFILSLVILTHNPSSLVAIPSLCIVGVLWGVSKYLILSNHTPKINGSWILLSAASIVSIPFIAVYILKVMDGNLAWAVSVAIGAIFPYLVLKQHFLRASGWILANGVGIAISMATVKVVFKAVSEALAFLDKPPGDSGGGFGSALYIPPGDIVGFVVSLIVALAIYGAITCGTLIWLLRNPRRK